MYMFTWIFLMSHLEYSRAFYIRFTPGRFISPFARAQYILKIIFGHDAARFSTYLSNIMATSKSFVTISN